MSSRDGTIEYLPLDSKIGGPINYDRPSIGQFLTREQASYVYKKTESGEMINVDTIQQEIEQEEQLNKINDMSGETNPHRELIVNNAGKIEVLMTQMEHDGHHMIICNFSIKAVNKYKNSLETKGERVIIELDFGVTPRILYKEYLDVCEGTQSEIVNTMRFDENSDLSTTYLGRSDKKRNDKLKAEESFPISEHGYT